MTAYKAHASPTKDFFVTMITKDIALEDCILDLIDNSLDGARKVMYAKDPGLQRIESYVGFNVAISYDENGFLIADNCGGISISEAIEYAFHFGRRPDAPSEGDYSIGLYGIGMKRAIFKMGKLIDIVSSTAKEAFNAKIDVIDWLERPDDWDFDFDDAPVDPETGTKIAISDLYQQISNKFTTASLKNSLLRIIGRDYSQFISKGFEIIVNGGAAAPFDFTIRESEEFKPGYLKYMDETGVEVEIFAGMAGAPPDDLSPTETRPETDYYGWFVLCNDRVVAAADKSDRTVWGNGGFPVWHYQYNGFVGVVSFHARDAGLLPWTTTKRDVDQSSQVYRRAVAKMQEATRAWLVYTNDRKADLEGARRRESAAIARPLLSARSTQITPILPAIPRIETTYIQFSKPKDEVTKAKVALGNKNMSNTAAGTKMFEYFMENEVGE